VSVAESVFQVMVPLRPEIMKNQSFMEMYLDYTYNNFLTDAPKIYHEFASLNLLSLAVGRTQISITPRPLYPNIWTILIGRSGVTRKSTAIDLALSVLPEDYEFLPNDFTPESLQEALSENAQGLIIKDEIGGFLERIKKREYMSGTADLMCQLYGCPSYYNKKLRSVSFELKDVCFNVFSATTPSRFASVSKREDFQSGFLSRFLIIYGEKKVPIPRRRWTKRDDERLNRCRTLWKQIHDVFHNSNMSFEFEPQALELVNAWQTQKEEEILRIDDDTEADLKGAVTTRMAEYIYKFSALYEVDSISKNSVSKLVNSSILITTESVNKSTSTIDNLLTLLTTNLTNSRAR